MRISVVIPAFNEERYIGACLTSCIAQVIPDVMEIIVVDNASTDGTVKIAQSFPGVRVVHEATKGLTYARERGLKEAKGDALFWMDADSIVPQDWFQRMKETLEQPGVVCASGPYKYYDIPLWKYLCVDAYWRIGAQITYFFTRYMLVGGNFVVWKKALMQAGEFDTSIQFYGEDTDIGRRLAKIGKVAFRQKCWIGSSGRRLQAEGMIRTPIVYVLNYFWIAVFHKPLTADYKDIR